MPEINSRIVSKVPGGYVVEGLDGVQTTVSARGLKNFGIPVPPVSVVEDSIPLVPVPEPKPLDAVVGTAGNSKVLQHPSGAQTVVGKAGLENAGFKS